MPDQKVSELTPAVALSGSDLFYLSQAATDRSLTGTLVKAFTDQTAAGVPFTPTGDIGATDVQGALAELDTEKSPTTHQHAIDDLTDVDTSTMAPTLNDVLTWDGSQWEPAAPPG